MASCFKCKAVLKPAAKFCNLCGANQATAPQQTPLHPTCGKCQQPLKPNSRFCQGCGSAVTFRYLPPQSAGTNSTAPAPAPAPTVQKAPSKALPPPTRQTSSLASSTSSQSSTPQKPPVRVTASLAPTPNRLSDSSAQKLPPTPLQQSSGVTPAPATQTPIVQTPSALEKSKPTPNSRSSATINSPLKPAPTPPTSSDPKTGPATVIRNPKSTPTIPQKPNRATPVEESGPPNDLPPALQTAVSSSPPKDFPPPLISSNPTPNQAIDSDAGPPTDLPPLFIDSSGRPATPPKQKPLPAHLPAKESNGLHPKLAETLHGMKRPARGSMSRGIRVVDMKPVQTTAEGPKAPGPEDEEQNKRRNMIIGELISTEKNYVSNLQDLCFKFRQPMLDELKTHAKSSTYAHHSALLQDLFSNVDPIRKINEKLLADLEKAHSEGGKIGPILTSTVPFFKLYATYSSNYEKALKAIEELMQLEWWPRLVPDKYIFDSLLITPIQRIPRYRLLIEDLLKSTSLTHPDYTELLVSLNVIKDTAARVNEGTRTEDGSIYTTYNLTKLIAAHRRLKLQGELTISMLINYDSEEKKPKRFKKPHMFFLFNDILVYLKQPKHKDAKKKSRTLGIGTSIDELRDMSSLVKEEEPDAVIWPLELVWITDLDENSFEIKGPMRTISVFSDKKQKAKWLDAICESLHFLLSTGDSLNATALKELSVGPNTKAKKEIDLAAMDLSLREGKFQFVSGALYFGLWDLGRMHKQGTYEFMGSYYEGDFMLNVMEGNGIFEFTDGSIYTGQFKEGKPWGEGQWVNLAGDRYVGSWVNGKRTGKGILTYASGDRATGTWMNNQYESGELYLHSSQSTYRGLFENGKYHGKGSLESPSRIYHGEFDCGRENGEGSVKYIGSRIAEYTGTLKNGLRNGGGKLVTAEWEYLGQFSKDLFEGKGRFEYLHVESVYDGNFVLDLKSGKGKQTCQTGFVTSYQGDWVNGVRHGWGELVFGTGDTYTGSFQNGQIHGNGKLCLSTGYTFEGKFTNGLLEGKIEITSPKGEIISVDETGSVKKEQYVQEFLVPPFSLLFQFQ